MKLQKQMEEAKAKFGRQLRTAEDTIEELREEQVMLGEMQDEKEQMIIQMQNEVKKLRKREPRAKRDPHARTPGLGASQACARADSPCAPTRAHRQQEPEAHVRGKGEAHHEARGLS